MICIKQRCFFEVSFLPIIWTNYYYLLKSCKLNLYSVNWNDLKHV